MQRFIIPLVSFSFVLAVGCGAEIDDELLLEDATFIAALSAGEGERIEESQGGDIIGSTDENIDDTLSGELSFNRDCSLRAVRRRVIDSYDTDGDGSLNEGEREGLRADFGEQPRRRMRWARHHRMRGLIWIYDADESGDLSEQERQELRDDLEQRCANRMAWLITTFDADGDGMLNDVEWQAAHDELVARIQARRQEMLAQFDTNGNGMLDSDERDAAFQYHRGEMQQRRDRFRAQFDTNGDGTLDEQERATAREELKKRVRGEYIV